MEDLNKQQMILLALLVSFVTSIATGITTVSLLAQAPQGVTQTINNVVERTIETVVPGEKQVVVREQPKEVTVVVKEEDLVIKAVDSIKNSLVRIENKRTDALLGLGFIVRADGLVAADISIVGLARDYEATYKGQKYPLTFADRDLKTGIAYFKLPVEVTVLPVTFADASSLKPGQTVVSISGAERDVVSIGIISSLMESEVKTGEVTSKEVSQLETTISSSTLLPGTPFLSLDGKVVGLKAGKNDSGSDKITSINILKASVLKVQ